ncbi:MAG TPA: carbohydrate-binding domain-containing protein, partial [Bacteroides sp.]|nr:carbohydrate-binding domain-containing protein [Bacteroides sp.]
MVNSSSQSSTSPFSKGPISEVILENQNENMEYSRIKKPEIPLKLICTMLILVCSVSCDQVFDPFSTEKNNGTIISESESYHLSVADAMDENCEDHEAEGDETWDSNHVTHISLQGNTVTIKNAGSYLISGTLEDGQLIVDTKDNAIVRLILDNVNISCSWSAAVYIANAEKVVIILADESKNQLIDGTSYVFEEEGGDEPNAALFSKDDLTICGSGRLSVKGNYNDGIAGKDGVIIKDGIIKVNAVDDGIRGKDYLILKNVDIQVTAGGDGMKSDEDEDVTKGYILVESGIIDIASGGDAIKAESDLLVSDGEITLSCGRGSDGYLDETISTKGIKASLHTVIDGGTITVDASDDAIHSNGTMSVNGGTMILSTGDDGFHADSILGINGGDITITGSYEGIESAVIAISRGNIHITCSDDGLNVAGGNDGSGRPGGPGWPGTDQFSSSGNYFLFINGGYVSINADGDGIDVNGSIVMTGGEVIIDGPVFNMNGALDCDGVFQVEGGFLLG